MIPVVIALIDACMLNAFYFGASRLSLIPEVNHDWFLWNISYLISILVFHPVAQRRLARVEQVINRSFLTALLMAVIYQLYIIVDRDYGSQVMFFVLLTISLTMIVFASRYMSRFLLMSLRSRGRNTKSVVFVGAGHNLAYLYDCMHSNLATGYRFIGYFDEHKSEFLPKNTTLLGGIDQVIPWLKTYRPDMIFCNLPSSRGEEIVSIINYCEQHFIHFYSVPNVRNYVHRAMEVEMIDDMPVLKLRKEPLLAPANRISKRLFDIVVSSIFIVTCFWWIYLIVAIVTKLTMPGPVIFRQKRNGLLGEEFDCLKFRSMRVNSIADLVQATRDDERVTCWGHFLRRTSLDELPQFINVLKGEMSIVGPRPHMILHTVEYSALIDKYMVRHWIKPGITGWAQVNGARGETSQLWQMEDRIKKDIWYIENWSFGLDLRILFRTVWELVKGDKNAY
ncbi:MAG: undecaprenyl-phosphate glucose phosphotransferase [Bacteroidales bacterium]|nr:undecaprenyl-phosphate glucose phosphotransferase [Candidatus Liminaster caballi]